MTQQDLDKIAKDSAGSHAALLNFGALLVFFYEAGQLKFTGNKSASDSDALGRSDGRKEAIIYAAE